MKKIAVVGATGNVGREVLAVLAERKHNDLEVYALASPKSIGKKISFGTRVLTVEGLEGFDFGSVEVAFFCGGGELARKYRQKVTGSGCVMIDNSSAFRLEEGVPLVVADINMAEVANYKDRMILSNANCVASPLASALDPLLEYGVKRVVASTYQSVSGAGKQAMDELYKRTKAFYEISTSGREVTELGKEAVFTKDIAFNCIPHIDYFLEDGRTKEEWKVEMETRKILNNDSIKISATCVRVPVFVGHAISANIELESPFELDDIFEKLSSKEGIVLMDRRENGGYATQRDVVRSYGVYISRVRRDDTLPNGLSLWAVADNVYGIGAAYNAVRIFEELKKYI